MFTDLSFAEGFTKVDAELDVIYVPTDELVVEAMLKMADVTASDILYDLGCGDGRIVVAAAMERGAHAVGVDMDPRRIAEANNLAEMVNVEDRVQFIQDDLLTVDFSDATVVTLYLLPSLNVKLKARILTELKPGARIIAHAFNMGRWQPDAKRAMGGVYLYKWVVPAPLQGTWEWLTDSGKVYRVALEQTFQMLSGQAWIDDEQVELLEAKVLGTRVRLVIQAAVTDEPEVFISSYQEGVLLPAIDSKQVSAGVRRTV
ncbi:class I SAM-dependent methyltransferase [Denitrificimonas caeni]|uniref:Class I SAM-dependent methyltransferase n=1 Tax=Denitrificimonas caeni TaxID=521720 RepID=A0AAE9VMV5_9GAMM|nr:class I SAM-dependent methyltransferase [Denitrificimonas caeni]WBE24697.1 class I SAM-dependent methyltransferase [Denitrificimonas caeni]